MSRPAPMRRPTRWMVVTTSAVTALAVLQGVAAAGITSGIDRGDRVRRGVGDVVDAADDVVDVVTAPVEETAEQTVNAINATPEAVAETTERAAETASSTTSTVTKTVRRTASGSPVASPVRDATRRIVRRASNATNADEIVRSLDGSKSSDGRPATDLAVKVGAASARPATDMTTAGKTSAAFLRKPQVRGQQGDPADGDLPALVSLGNVLTGDRVLGSRIGEETAGSGRLAFTGAGVSGYVAIGLLLVALGSIAALAGRRRWGAGTSLAA